MRASGFKLMERDDPMDVDFVHKESQKCKVKRNDKGKGKSKGKSKGKGKQNEKGKEFWDRQVESRKVRKVFAETVARQDIDGVNVGRKAAEPRNKRTVSAKTGENW